MGSPLLITRGYGTIPGFIPEIIDGIVRRNRAGGGGAKRRRQQEELLRELEPIIVWAKLIEVNNMPPKVHIEGSTTVSRGSKSDLPTTKVEYVTKRVRAAWEDIKVTVKRLK